MFGRARGGGGGGKAGQHHDRLSFGDGEAERLARLERDAVHQDAGLPHPRHHRVRQIAGALRSAVLLAASLSPEEEAQVRTLISRHIEKCLSEDWPAMAQQRTTLTTPPAALTEALQRVLAFAPTNDGQRTAQREITSALQSALDARRQRIVISQSTVNSVKWSGLLLAALVTLIAIAMVHSDNRLTCAIALTLFATTVALSVFLIAAHNRPFTGEISVGPELLKQVIPSEAQAGSGH